LENEVGFSDETRGKLTYDHVDHYGELTFKYNTQYTVFFWIKFTGAINNDRAIIDIGNINPSVRIYLQNSKVKVQHTSSFAAAGAFSNNIVSTNTWVNYGISTNSTNITIYKNGIFDNSGTTTSNPKTDTSQLGIANHPIGSSSGIQNLQCDISIIKIYNRALTPQEVQQNYNATKSRFGLT